MTSAVNKAVLAAQPALDGGYIGHPSGRSGCRFGMHLAAVMHGTILGNCGPALRALAEQAVHYR